MPAIIFSNFWMVASWLKPEDRFDLEVLVLLVGFFLVLVLLIRLLSGAPFAEIFPYMETRSPSTDARSMEALKREIDRLQQVADDRLRLNTDLQKRNTELIKKLHAAQHDADRSRSH